MAKIAQLRLGVRHNLAYVVIMFWRSGSVQMVSIYGGGFLIVLTFGVKFKNCFQEVLFYLCGYCGRWPE